jgi:hypothetical protein
LDAGGRDIMDAVGLGVLDPIGLAALEPMDLEAPLVSLDASEPAGLDIFDVSKPKIMDSMPSAHRARWMLRPLVYRTSELKILAGAEY